MERYDFVVHRGETFRRVLRFKRSGEVVNLTGYEGKCQVRECPDGGQLLCEISVSVNGPGGTMVLMIPASVCAGFLSGLYAWDLRVTSPASVAAFYLGGQFRVLPSVTE